MLLSTVVKDEGQALGELGGACEGQAGKPMPKPTPTPTQEVVPSVSLVLPAKPSQTGARREGDSAGGRNEEDGGSETPPDNRKEEENAIDSPAGDGSNGKKPAKPTKKPTEQPTPPPRIPMKQPDKSTRPSKSKRPQKSHRPHKFHRTGKQWARHDGNTLRRSSGS